MRPKVPGEELTIEEMNKTLSLDYIFKHEPFEDLPLQYYPNPSYHHKPPIFDYGVALTTEQVKDYARKNGIIPANVEHPTLHQWTKMYSLMLKKFNDRYKLHIPGKRVEVNNPCSDQCLALFKVSTNYDLCVPEDKVMEILDVLEETLGQPAKWYLSNDNEVLEDDYSIHIPEHSTALKSETENLVDE
ncbi:hypothetical protein VNI00_006045 [Paramarasmius palmivorus]|uniref:Uncharacterized protein n=1 Tax=Paramarasmius palmivorus TaxID=297713 RepID=A0AAW0DE04_9AGAR